MGSGRVVIGIINKTNHPALIKQAASAVIHA